MVNSDLKVVTIYLKVYGHTITKINLNIGEII